MEVRCNKCNTVTNIPDEVIPDEGIKIECPNCSNPMFVNPDMDVSEVSLSFDNIDMTGIKSSLDSFAEDSSEDIEVDMGPSLEMDDISIDVDHSIGMDIDISLDGQPENPSMETLSQQEISPSMIMDIPKVDKNRRDQADNNSTKVGKPIKEVNNPAKNKNISAQTKKQPVSQVESYLSLKTATVQKNDNNLIKIAAIVAILLIAAVGGFVYHKISTPQDTITSIKELKLESILKDLNQDNYYNYKYSLDEINKQINHNSKEVMLKAAYVYTGVKYYLSIGERINKFTPKYKKYLKDINKPKYLKNNFINKTVMLDKLFSSRNRKKVSPALKQKIFSLAGKDSDYIYMKGYILYLEKSIDKLQNLVDNVKISDIDKIPLRSLLMELLLNEDKNISIIYTQIQTANPSHISSKLKRISYFQKYKMISNIKKVIAEIDKLKKFMGDYELTKYYLIQAEINRKEANLKEAYKFVRRAEQLDIDNYQFFKQILNFYYENYYTASALEILKTKFNSYKNKLDINEIYIQLLIRNESYGEAGKICSKLRDKFPKDPRVYYISAILSKHLDNSTKTVDYIQKALSIDPEFQKGYVLLAQEYIKMNNKDKALNILKEGNEKIKDSPTLLAGLADIYFDLNQYSKAKPIYKELITKNSSGIDINSEFKLGLINYYENKNLPMLIEKLNALYKIAPNYENLRISLAKYENLNKKYDKVIDLMKTEMKIRKKSLDAYLELGKAYYNQKDYTNALEFLQKGLGFSPKYAPLHFYIAKSYYKKDQFQKAVDSFQMAHSYEATNPLYLIELARANKKLNRFEDAIQNYNDLSKLKISFDLYFERGKIYFEIGNNNKAIEDFTSAYQLNPDHIELILALGDLYFKIAKYNKALKYYNLIIRKDKTQDRAYFRVGKIYEMKGKSSKAVRYYQKAIKLNKKVSKYYTQLGYLYKGMEKYKKALNIFKAYLRNIPNTPDREEIETEIYDLKNL